MLHFVSSHVKGFNRMSITYISATLTQATDGLTIRAWNKLVTKDRATFVVLHQPHSLITHRLVQHFKQLRNIFAGRLPLLTCQRINKGIVLTPIQHVRPVVPLTRLLGGLSPLGPIITTHRYIGTMPQLSLRWQLNILIRRHLRHFKIRGIRYPPTIFIRLTGRGWYVLCTPLISLRLLYWCLIVRAFKVIREELLCPLCHRLSCAHALMGDMRRIPILITLYIKPQAFRLRHKCICCSTHLLLCRSRSRSRSKLITEDTIAACILKIIQDVTSETEAHPSEDCL